MTTRIFWIVSDKLKGLAIMARPRSGEWLEQEVANYKKEGIDIVVSLLEANEISELELKFEGKYCESAGINFFTFPIVDRGTPSSIKDTRKFIEDLLVHAQQNKKIAVHCRAGIGRSSMIAATILLHFGHDLETAFKLIAESRGVNVPDTEEQRLWVENYERLLRS